MDFMSAPLTLDIVAWVVIITAAVTFFMNDDLRSVSKFLLQAAVMFAFVVALLWAFKRVST